MEAKRTLPVIEVNGKKPSVTRSRIRMNQEGKPPLDGASFYQGSGYENSVGNPAGRTPESVFVFPAELKSNADLETDFIAVAKTRMALRC